MLYTLELILKFADSVLIFVELVYFLLMLYIFLDHVKHPSEEGIKIKISQFIFEHQNINIFITKILPSIKKRNLISGS